MKEKVDHPDHYNQGKYEVIDVIEDWNLGFCLGNAIKYICRYGHKGDYNAQVSDLKKAIHYLNDELIYLERSRNCEDLPGPASHITKQQCEGVPFDISDYQFERSGNAV